MFSLKEGNSENQETPYKKHHLLPFLPLVRKCLWHKEREPSPVKNENEKICMIYKPP